MATASEKQVWSLLVGVAVLGAGVRWMGLQRLDAALRAAHPGAQLAGEGRAGSRAALDRQRAAVDSARQAPRTRRSTRRSPGQTVSPADTSTRALPRSILQTEPVDVNLATVTDLERLPRIGPALARRLVAWREAHGPFQGPEDLRHVRGIGPATARRLADFVTFSGRRRPFSREASASTRDVPPPA